MTRAKKTAFCICRTTASSSTACKAHADEAVSTPGRDRSVGQVDAAMAFATEVGFPQGPRCVLRFVKGPRLGSGIETSYFMRGLVVARQLVRHEAIAALAVLGAGRWGVGLAGKGYPDAWSEKQRERTRLAIVSQYLHITAADTACPGKTAHLRPTRPASSPPPNTLPHRALPLLDIRRPRVDPLRPADEDTRQTELPVRCPARRGGWRMGRGRGPACE